MINYKNVSFPYDLLELNICNYKNAIILNIKLYLFVVEYSRNCTF